MKFYVLLVLFLFSGFLQTESNFVYIDDEKSFDDAVDGCNNRGLELLTISTYRQYLDAHEYYNTNKVGELWLALEKNTATGKYQWLNGRVLTELKWLSGEPKNYTGTDCGVMDVSSKQWYTRPCTDRKHYLCVGPDGSYSVSNLEVDFYTAVLNCQSEVRQLPVAITNLDTDWLKDVISNTPTTSISDYIWLGLIEYGDYYRWVTGEHLTPPYTWDGNGREKTVHYHSDTDLFHSDNKIEKKYLCQTKSTETAAVVRSPDKFVLVSDNALVLSSIRKATTINSLRRFQCALECLRDAGCIQYTIQGYQCRTFGDGLVITDYNGGYKLWQRKIIS